MKNRDWHGRGARAACPELAEGTAAEDGGATDPMAPDSSGADRSAGVPPAPSWATMVATVFGIGRLRPGPGTWGSAAAVLLWAVVAYALAPALRTPVAIGLAVAVTLIGIPAATLVARGYGAKDPQFVVVDEVAGQLVALIAVPFAWKSFLAGFILFRVFDIVKPPPVRQLEAIPEGAGIVLDDIAAGLMLSL